MSRKLRIFLEYSFLVLIFCILVLGYCFVRSTQSVKQPVQHHHYHYEVSE